MKFCLQSHIRVWLWLSFKFLSIAYNFWYSILILSLHFHPNIIIALACKGPNFSLAIHPLCKIHCKIGRIDNSFIKCGNSFKISQQIHLSKLLNGFLIAFKNSRSPICCFQMFQHPRTLKTNLASKPIDMHRGPQEGNSTKKSFYVGAKVANSWDTHWKILDGR